MAEISRKALFGKLNKQSEQSIRSAFDFCRLRGNPYIELVHWFQQILQGADSDLHRIVRHYGIDESRLARDLTTNLDGLPRGATSISDFSSHVEESIERAWVWASLLFGERAVRSGHLLVGIAKTPGLRNALAAMSGEFRKVKIDDLIENWSAVVGSSPEASGAAAGDASSAGEEADGDTPAPAQFGRQEALQKYTIDMTEQARQGKIDPIVGRDREIRQLMDILCRRRQNNPILTGEAGVGKTAVVEGFAMRIASGDVPPMLADVSLRALDVGLLQAGAGVKGEFEKRLRQVIEEVQSSQKPIIMFIDETHTLVGAGGAAGTGDAANLLKPALARGTLRTVGATTWAEYKKYIEKDPALTRRFQAVAVGEPSEEDAVTMMRTVSGVLQRHHKVLLRDEALSAAVRLSHRYVPARKLPDKAVSLLDTACARVSLSQHGVPAVVEECRRRISALETEREILEREKALGIPADDRLAAISQELDVERATLTGLETRWTKEKELVKGILDCRMKLDGSSQNGNAAANGASAAPDTTATSAAPGGAPAATPVQTSGGDAAASVPAAAEGESVLAQLASLEKELVDVQGDSPLVLTGVTADSVAGVVADWTGIPVGKMVRNEIAAVLTLADRLGERIKGQDHALKIIAKRVQTSRAGLDNPSKPVGVFMLAGPSGVGKTETALALAEQLYGGEQNVITINMSEFQESHTVSTLKGAPPGYKGYEEGGVLTEAVRRRPHSVVLLDEVEKAHPDVHEIFFQVFDKGVMEDGSGTLINFKNTLILLTSNVGSEVIMAACQAGKRRPEVSELESGLRKELLEVFPAALLGRIVTVPYYPLDESMLHEIVKLQLKRIENRVSEGHRVPFTYGPAVVDLIVKRCTEVESGGRMVDAILTNTILPVLSREILERLADQRSIQKVHVDLKDGELAYEFD